MLAGTRRLRERAYEALSKDIDRCRANGSCGYPACGKHAVGKPTHQLGKSDWVLVVGEAPAADSWWLTRRAFHRTLPGGRLEPSRTGKNLNQCLRELGLSIDAVCYIEAVKCRPKTRTLWRPDEKTRRRCRRFLENQVIALKPRLILTLGLTALKSCIEAFANGEIRPGRHMIGQFREYRTTWGHFYLLPLYHPSPANNGRWPNNIEFMRVFRNELQRRSDFSLRAWRPE